MTNCFAELLFEFMCSQCSPCLRGAMVSVHHGGTEFTEEVLEYDSLDAVFHQRHVEVH